MIRTPICDLLDIEHPIALGGMGSASSPAMTAAVSRAGGLGAMGCHYLTPEQVRERAEAARKETNKPFGMNFLLFDVREDSFAEALRFRPAPVSMKLKMWGVVLLLPMYERPPLMRSLVVSVWFNRVLMLSLF